MSKLIIPDGVALTLAMPPVGPLTLEDPQGKVTFTLKPDITAHEVALILHLFIRMTLGGPGGATPDWRKFIDEHKITRHFTPVT